MVPTIAERAANGEVLYAPHLNREERKELLAWARAQGMEYKEIKTKYGFEESDNTLRGWQMSLNRGRMPRVAIFTDEDDRLLLLAVEEHSTQRRSLNGIWTQVGDYIRDNGGTTTAGPRKLKERWYLLTGQEIPAHPSSHGSRGNTGRGGATRTELTAPAHSTQTDNRQNQATPSVMPAPNMDWGFYPDLTWVELVDVLGIEDAREYVRDRLDEVGDVRDDWLVALLGREGAEQYKRDIQGGEDHGGDEEEQEEEEENW
ncbi:hypothetical protein KVR01_004168 [Diaporthe batatas]|uniref:uncharacterized protein n=1 Tax=Diaporthe batatas TaxID=748121 RepID=UPI001D0394EA|nr:uncharacterized protein KVR01_004168 [Diaporthe batatas]KAG8165616.1 hypothetical protein KVR01_004168 [Diaporthe batatas]